MKKNFSEYDCYDASKLELELTALGAKTGSLAKKW